MGRSKRRRYRKGFCSPYRISVSNGDNNSGASTSENLGNMIENNNDSLESTGALNPKRHPPNLLGKEIGLWYRDQNRKQKKSTNGDKNKPKLKRDVPVISLSRTKINDIYELLSAPETKLFLNSNKYEHDQAQRFFKSYLNGTYEEKLQKHTEQSFGYTQRTNEELRCEFLNKQMDLFYIMMQEKRQKLPAFQMKRLILEKIEYNQVLLISGETGCGKTTQVPQFLLDHALISGQGCSYRIACTQPRRISAITIAERVAEERNEKCGNSVGYQIRLEKKLPRDYASIVFCTTGIILQKLDGDPLLNEYSHIIIDEIHERDINCDLLLTVLKEKVIPYRKDLKVILMSATLNAQIFSKYFDNCEILHIPGFCFHVKQFFLEDILEELQFFDFDIPTAKKEKKLGRLGNDLQEKMFEYIKLNRNKYSPKVFQALQNPRSELINVELITKLVWHIYDTQPQGAILIFLPGAKMITSLHNMLDCESNRTRRCLLIYPLHSQMPTAYQKEIFQIPPFGFRKVIISTNIAETSITVEDVKYVIDCGKCKLKTFDIDTKLESLSDHWVSIANMKQRKGRAGRTSEGVSYHLFSRPRLSTFIDYQLPEMLRTRIEEVILRIKLLQLGDISDFLKNVLDPPDEKVVKFSIELLQRLNALDAAQNLTPLGYHLAQLPMDPQIGKMILMASLFSCVEPIFSIAASLAYKDAFVYPIGKEQQVNNRKIELSNNTRSDHLMLSEVMSGFEDAQMSNQVSSYCWKNFVNAPTLHLLQDMKKEFAVHLYDKHFLYSKDVQEPISNMHSHNVKLLRAIVCAGLYPNVAYARVGKQRNKKPARIKFFSMEGGIPKYVEFHPGSVNAMEKYFDSHYFVFHKKMKTSKVYLYDTTMVDPLALIFFGDNIVKGIEDDIEFISVDGMQFRCKNEIADIILQLKKYLDDILLFKVSNARYVDWKNDCDTEVKILTMISELIGGENSYDSDDDSE